MKGLLVLAAIAVALSASSVRAQYGEANMTSSNLYTGDARLFVVTTGDQLVVLDLPSGRTSARLQLPLPSTLLRLTNDHRYFLAFRSRTYGPEYMSVVRTGVVRGAPAGADVEKPYADPYTLPSGTPQLLGLPWVTRTIDIGDSLVPSHDDYLQYHAGQKSYFVSEEKRGAFLMFKASDLENEGAWNPRVVNLLQPDHYAVLPWGDNVFVGYIGLNSSNVKLMTLTGDILESHTCAGVHGTSDWSNSSMMVGAFGCTDGIRIVYGGNRTAFVTTETRVGSFVHGYGSVIFGIGRDLESLYRVDLAASNPAVTKVSSGGERRAHVHFDDNRYFAQIHTAGNLTVHDGITGAVLARTSVMGPLDLTALPSMAVYKNRFIYITVPALGLVKVVQVDWPARAGQSTTARVVDQIPIGGRPLRVLLAD